jgi:hypothetical protein
MHAEPPRFSPGDRVHHYGQKFARTHPGGTAVVVEVKGPHHDGAYEYVVDACEEFTRLPSADNPMTRRTQWASYMTLPAFDNEES